MLHDILPSDIELARGMLDKGLSDAEIQSYLTSRGIAAEQAAALLTDLRHGRSPPARLPFAPEPKGATGDAAILSPARPHRHRRRHRHRARSIPWWFILVVVVFLAALGYALFEAGNSLAINQQEKDKHEVPAHLQKQ